MTRYMALLFGMALTLPTLVSAHELWVEPTGEGTRIICGHAGDIAACEAASIGAVNAVDKAGREIGLPAKIASDGTILTRHRDIAAIVVTQEEGFYTLTPDGEQPQPKRLVKNAVESVFLRNFAKTLLFWAAPLAKPLGGPLEVVPLKNPLAMKPGGKLPIVVYCEGKPCPEVWVDDGTNDGIREKTDENGRLTVTIGASGRQFVTAFLTHPYPDPRDADSLKLSANLNYLVK